MSVNKQLQKRMMTCVFFSFLFISCATTKVLETNDVFYDDNKTSTSIIKTSEHIEAVYEPNIELIFFDTFGMPFVLTGLALRETGRVAVYTSANVFLGYIYGMFEDGDFMDALWLPDIEQTKKELEELNNKFSESDYLKYKKYTKHWAKTTLKIKRLIERIDLKTEESRIISETNFTIIYIDSIQDTVQRVSKKSSLDGETIGSYTTKVVAFTPYSLGWLIGKASRK